MLRFTNARWATALLVPLVMVVPLHAGDGPHRDLVYLATDRGVAVVDSTTGEKTLSAKNAMPSGDWSLVVGTHRAKGRTIVDVMDPAGGAPVMQQQIDGNLEVRAVSHQGDLVALMPRDPEKYGNDGVYAPASRTTTRIVVTRLDGMDPYSFDLDANVEPEAFSADGSALFVIQYLPPMDPDRYRVRRLDLVTGELADVFTDDKLIQGDMRGTAFDQASAPDGSRLYTLYRKHTGETFVHLLDLVNHTAQCVLLPNHFGTKPAAMAITARADGAVFVVDPAVHEIAELAPEHHGVAQSRPYDALDGDDRVVAAATDDAIFVGSGNEVVELREPGLEPGGRWELDSEVEALHVGANGILYIAVRDRLLAVARDDIASVAEPLLEVEVDGIRGIGDSLPVTAKGTVDCAC